jgi:hypothetical protein
MQMRTGLAGGARGGLWLAIAPLLLLAGCQKSFDERYAEAQKQINDTAGAIDKDLAARASEVAMIDGLESEGALPTVAPSARAN